MIESYSSKDTDTAAHKLQQVLTIFATVAGDVLQDMAGVSKPNREPTEDKHP
jgi:hypothetical protein